MKKGYIKLLILELIMITSLLIYGFGNNLDNMYYAFYLGLILIISYILMGFEKEETIHRLDVIRNVFVYSMIYLMAIYILGFMIGFLKNPYSLEIMKIIKNILPIVTVIVIEELIRYNITKKSQGKKRYAIIIALIFVAFEISQNIGFYPLTTGMEIFELIGLLILPSIARNALLTYIAFKGFYKPNIIYRLIFSLNIYILPIYPNLGVYLESVLGIIIPTLIYMTTSRIFYQKKLTDNKKEYKSKLVLLPSTTLLIVTIILTSGIFKYYAMAVGSGSMEPTIKVGDAIIVEKVDEFKIGDILVHQHKGKIILHRIIKTENINEETCYVTQGDANKTEDNYIICKNDIKGKAVFIIPKIGWPSVKIERFMTNK